jgi:type II secretion system protein N
MKIQRDSILQWSSQAWNTVKERVAAIVILKKAAYILYFLILFFLFLYLLFPYNKLKERLIYEIEDRSSFNVRINKLSPLLFNGVRLIDIEALNKNDPKKTLLFKGDAKLRFGLLQLIKNRLSVKGSITAYDGEAIFTITSKKITGEIKGIELSAYPALNAVYGVNVNGRINGRLDLASDADIIAKNGLNLKKANGDASFNIVQLFVRNLSIIGFKIPDTSFDAVQSELRLDQGRLNIKRLSLEGRELIIQVTGDILLTENAVNSPLNIKIRLKPSIRFEEENKLLFSISKKDNEGYYNFNIRGTLMSPNAS